MKQLIRPALVLTFSTVWAAAIFYLKINGWVSKIPDLVVVLLAAGPLSIACLKFVFAAMDSGRTHGILLKDGRHCARIKVGARIVLVFFVLPLGTVMLKFAFEIGAAGAGVATALFAVFVAAIGLIMIYEVVYWLFTKLRWNEEAIEGPDFWGRQKLHLWSDLSKIEQEAYQDKLHFTGSGVARVSKYSAGHSDILEIAESKLNNA